MGFLKLIFACTHCALCDLNVSIRQLTFNTNVSACFIWILQTVSAKVTTSIRPSLTPVDRQLYTIIELMTFFHEFSKYDSTYFFTNISVETRKKIIIGQKWYFVTKIVLTYCEKKPSPQDLISSTYYIIFDRKKSYIRNRKIREKKSWAWPLSRKSRPSSSFHKRSITDKSCKVKRSCLKSSPKIN